MYNEFFDEFCSIVDKLQKKQQDIPLEKVAELFYELSTTEEIKEKLVLFSVCISEMSKIGDKNGLK